ncbi:MAG: MBL fold metallo-hydrolase [Bacilli bacterium]|jgi:hydroxyacylglutathione hydrolase|nr:MBL fold metallo-hydrolase [Bacilli bacterium]
MRIGDMEIKTVVVGSYATNCYLLKLGKEVLIVDPGDEFLKIKQEVGSDKVVGILITHRHFDHIGALDDCIATYQVPIYDHCNLKEQEYKIGPFHFDVLFTPGHTDDSVTYYFKDYQFFLVGDFIFCGSIGRMDLGGNETDMKESIRKLYRFHTSKIEALLLPGHGIHTDLLYEQFTNPYIQRYIGKDGF